MLIDCETCVARDIACRDCVVNVLLASPPEPIEIDDAERTALRSLAQAGLVPPLRLVTPLDAGPAGREIA